MEQSFNRTYLDSPTLVDQPPQGIINRRLAFVGRQLQDLQIELGCLLRVSFSHCVVRHAEPAGREQFLPVTVILEGSGLAHQPVDHMTIVDPALTPTTQPRNPFDQTLTVPDFHILHIQTHVDLLVNQTTIHRIDVVIHIDQASRMHTHIGEPFVALQPLGGQRPHHRHLFGQTTLATSIQLILHRFQEPLVRPAVGEVPAATQHQSLVYRLFEPVVTLLHIPVLVGVARLRSLRPEAVVAQQRLVATLERAPTPLLQTLPCRVFRARRRLQMVHRRREPIGPMRLRPRTQLPQRVLQSLA